MGKEPPESDTKAEGLTPKLGRWTGFGEKKLWDFLELLIVPVILAVGAFYLEDQASNRQEKIADDRYKQEQRIANSRYQQEQSIANSRYQQETLKAYFDQITQLLLEKNLRQSNSEAQVIARARTLSALGELDENRKGLLLKFLNEANLITQDKRVISLVDANLRGANLSEAYLIGANLRGANLSEANLRGANLRGASLSGTNLIRASLSGANLSEASLSGASLSGVNLSGVNLSQASLSGVNLSGVNLNGANLSRANLSGTNLSGANLSRANLSGTNLVEAKYTTGNTKPEFCNQISLTFPCATKFPPGVDPIAEKMVLFRVYK